ncbi:MAG: glycosyltransferase family 2 protein, partial [Acidimicrobiales bacterium]
MESLAPPVVAVIVAHDPGQWFEETLASFGSQTYEELSILVLDAASAGDLTERVADVLPNAYVRRFGQNRGFGATANEVSSMVGGAAYYVICHDDVALAPDAVQFLVEEAFRSNAGIVSPKLVSWDDPGRLLEVGMTADKGGSVVGRVQPQEIDHGQHDSVRDVFVAPGGCTLIRADLFSELGGFDPAIVAMGEDLDFCWRAQVAGARIIVAPDARVRHREGLASGERALEQSLVDRVGPAEDMRGPSASGPSEA